MEYIEVIFKIEPFTAERAEIIEAMVSDLDFESFVSDETSSLQAYIKIEKFGAQCKQNLKCILSFFDNNPDFKITWEIALVPEQNWNLPWESDFKPIVIDKLCTVKADYHNDVPHTRFNIKIRPNMAFGTGHHQTTTMMMRTLLRLAGIEPNLGESRRESKYSDNLLKDKQLLDIGTGTGVLAILAAKLGSKRPVHAIDVDLTAVNSAKENMWLNRMHKAVEVLYGDASLIQASKYDFILANINRNILLNDMDTYSRGLISGGYLIMSGFYERDISKLVARGAECDLTLIGYETFGGKQVCGKKLNSGVCRDADLYEGCGEGDWSVLVMQCFHPFQR